MTRKRTTVYLDEDVWAIAIAKGFNISKICRDALSSVVRLASKDTMETEINALRMQADAIEKMKTRIDSRQALLEEFAEKWNVRIGIVPLDDEHEQLHLSWIGSLKKNAGLGDMEDREILEELEKQRKSIIGSAVDIGR